MTRAPLLPIPSGIRTLAVAALLVAATPAVSPAGGPAGPLPEDPAGFRPATPEEALRILRRDRDARVQRARAAGAPRFESAPADAEVEGTWREWAPPSRSEHALVHDSRRDRLILLGGDHYSGGRANLWQLALGGPSRWTPLEAAAAPPPAEHVAAAYDHAHDRIVAFLTYGGNGAPLRGEVWTLAFAGSPAWSRLEVAGQPDVQWRQNVALAADGSRLYLACADLGLSPVQAWRVDLAPGAAWTAISESGPTIQHTHTPDLLVDEARGRLVIAAAGGLWQLPLAGGAWTQLHAAASDPARLLHDRAGDRGIRVTTRGDVEVIALASGAYTAAPGCAQCLPNRSGFAAAWDAARGRAVMHGGWDAQRFVTRSQTLAHALDGAGWSDLGLSSGGARLWHSVVRDPARDRAIVYGGSWWGAELVATRALDDPLGTTQPLPTGAGPRPRAHYYYTLDFDPAGDRLLVYGGQAGDGSGEVLDEVWALPMASPAWSLLPATGDSPGRRMGHVSFVEPSRNRLVVIGGSSADPDDARAWALDLATLAWRPLALTGLPAGGVHFARLDYDAAAGRAWGWWSGDPGAAPALLWRLDVSADAIAATPVPFVNGPGRGDWHRFAPLIFDSNRGRLIVNEQDYHSRAVMSGYWSVELGASAVWSYRAAGGNGRPFDRFLHAALYDPDRDRAVIYGGYDDGSRYFDDWWSLDWQGAAAPVTVSLERSEIRDGVAWLAWNTGGRTGDFDLERRRDGGAWTTLARLTPDGAGRVAYEDAAIEPGARYAWRLLWLGGDSGPVAYAETELTVPALAFAMHGTRQRPATGDLTLAFTLDRAGEARVGLYDVGGRRVIEHTVRAAAAGPGEITLAPRGAVAPGVYFARLSDGRRASVARVVVSR